MLRSELIIDLQKKYPSLSLVDIELILKIFFKKIIKSLNESSNVEIRGFGTLSKKINKAKYVRNPKTNEKTFKENNSFYCDNLDLKILPEGLNEYHEVQYIVRSSNKKGGQKINLKNIKVASNILKFIYYAFKTFKIPNVSYLLVCITPYTFLSFLILFLFRKRVFVYLFSSGHDEYKHILGSWSVWIYHIMYTIVTSNSKVIVCHERLYKKKSHLVYISRLNDEWIEDQKSASLDKVRFLYVGRMSPEKGIFEFLKTFDKIKFDAEFSIIGNSKNQKILNKNIKAANFNIDTINQKTYVFGIAHNNNERKEIIQEAKLIVDLKELVTSILMVSDLSRQKE